MKKSIFILICFVVACSHGLWAESISKKKVSSKGIKNIITATNKIIIDEYPKAFNPSIIKVDQGFLLTFREVPDPSKPWFSNIGIVRLNESLQPISKPQILNTRSNPEEPSQTEDARIFSCKGDLYVMYNDSNDLTEPWLSYIGMEPLSALVTPHSMDTVNQALADSKSKHRRDMFIAKLSLVGDQFRLSEPLKLTHEHKYATTLLQKNWVPFEWNGNLLVGYSIVPHEVLNPDMNQGVCSPFFETKASVDWPWGPLRGGTPATLVGGEYLAFFHSSVVMKSEASDGIDLWHYFMGAYTFSAHPPFNVTKITPLPLVTKSFYIKSAREKRVIYPGGYAISGSKIYVVYGKDDCEIWVATIDKNRLQAFLRPVK